MYKFVDTVEGSGTGSTSLSLQTIFNGFNLDEMLSDENGSFITLTVTGRANLAQRIETIEIPGLNGVLEQIDPTIDVREITVKYKIADKTNEGFRKRYNKFLALLEGSKKVLEFTDENALFYATLLENDVPEEESNNLVGTLTFLCSDPFKYGPEQVAPNSEPGNGRNYVLESEKTFSFSNAPTTVKYESLDVSNDIKNLIKADSTVTLSYDVKTDDDFKKGSTNPFVGMELKYIANDDIERYISYNSVSFDELPDGNNVLRLNRQFLIVRDLKEFVYLRVYFRDFSGTATLSNFKIELGDTATPWSPAPEDTGILEINNEGSAETFPVVEVKLKKPTTFVSIGNGNEINMIGEIPDAEEPVYEKYSNILMDYLSTTVGWEKIKFPPYTGTITDGIISADSQGFFPSSYGYVPGLEWHGPALAKSLSEPLQDLYMHFSSYLRATDPTSVGRQELYALDSANKPVMSLHFIKDSYGKVIRPEIIVYKSNGEPRKILSLKREQVPDWKIHYGYISIVREGRKIVARADKSTGLFGGVRDARMQVYEDVKDEYQRPVVSVAVVFQAYRQSPALNRNRAERVYMDKIVQKEGVPYIATTGDIITFDHPQNVIYKNGIEVNKEKAFIGQYFALKPGKNALAIEPADAIESMTARWQNRWR